ncbi:hypothetical protein C0585_05015 [Candidatus Woesearchaeota archaeon]|nr:MAG: hypothetical protein C0585_05015 [Candidatus Woesearchaeota archaeon]
MLDKKIRNLRKCYNFISQNEFELAVNNLFNSKKTDGMDTLFDMDHSHYYICENLENYLLKGRIVGNFERVISTKRFQIPPKYLNRLPYFGVKSQLETKDKQDEKKPLISYFCNGLENSYPSKELLMHLSPIEIISLFSMVGKWKEDMDGKESKDILTKTKASDALTTFIHAGYDSGIKNHYEYFPISDMKDIRQGFIDRVEQVTHNLISIKALQEFKESLYEKQVRDYSGLDTDKQLNNIYLKLGKLDLTSNNHQLVITE